MKPSAHPAQRAVPGVSLLTDFPERMPAMTVKELRQALRAPLFLWPFAGLQLAAFVATGGEYLLRREAGPRSWFAEIATGSPGLFWVTVYFLTSVIMPLRCLGALQEETTAGHGQLIMLTGLSRWRIVLGKWSVHMILTGLSLLSVAPYMLVRYFFGGVELVPNFLTLISVAGLAAAAGAIVIGASGAPRTTPRITVLVISGLWLSFAVSGVEFAIAGFTRAVGSVGLIALGYTYLFTLGFYALYTLVGLQLGRARLRLYQFPGEDSPVTAAHFLIVALPFILLAGAFATALWGVILVEAGLIFAVVNLDRAWRPARAA